MQQGAFDQIVERAAAKRATLPRVASAETNAFRLVDGSGDGALGIYIDSYAGHWLVQTRDVPFPDELRQIRHSHCEAIWWKVLTNANRETPRWISGADAPELVVRENGLNYVINFTSGYSQGIFLDQRENRKWLQRQCAKGDSVLNLFAYTCAFSVAAAAAGATTTSVDLSANYLDWGRRNFEANGIQCGEDSPHRYFKWDTFDFLKMASRKNERYQFIICDPPTFSRNKTGKVFRAETDYANLVERCVQLLSPGGTLLCSTNHRGISQRKFGEMVRQGFKNACKPLDELGFNPMPEDFTDEAYLKSCRARRG